MEIVLDCSVLANLYLPGEDRALIETILLSASQGKLNIVSPELLSTEFGNLLISAIKRKRLGLEEAKAHLKSFWQLPVKLLSTSSTQLSQSILYFADKYKLSFYDANYLAVANMRKAILASNDKALIKACKKEGIGLFGMNRLK